MAEEPPRCGLVMALQANYCTVALDQPGPRGEARLLCTRRARLDKSGQRICVGDRVRVEGIDWPSARGAVVGRQARRNSLERPAVANVDRLVVVIALAEPAPDPLQLTRFLISAEALGQPVHLVLSKADLVPPAQRRDWLQRLDRWGYDAMPISLAAGGAAGAGLSLLRQRLLAPGIAVVCGPSGVGKSSLLNALLPERQLRVAAVSGRLRRGRHTTRHVELYPLLEAGDPAQRALLADTPGFNRPDPPADGIALAPLFPEVRQRLADGSCRFANCPHLEDPGCVVGSDWERHSLYRQILGEQRPVGPGERPQGDQRRRGDRIEPLLQARWRQRSRRRLRQQDPMESEGQGAITPRDRAD